jgi:hypothetical protein
VATTQNRPLWGPEALLHLWVANEPEAFSALKRGGKHTFAVPGDPADPGSFSAVASDWLEWLAAHNYSHMTLVDHSYWLARFAAWAELRGVCRPTDVTLPVLEVLPTPRQLAEKA